MTAKDPEAGYRALLERELDTRSRRNARYSLRAFARDLGISAPRLSHILKGDYGLSRAAALAIARKLGWTTEDSEHFCDLVDAEHARSDQARRLAKRRIGNRQRRQGYQPLDLDRFRIVADWYHFALMELTRIEGFRNQPSWMAKALRVPIHETRAAIRRLRQLGLLEEMAGKLAPTGQFIANPGGVPSEAVRQFHRGILEQARGALDAQSVSEREFLGVVLAIDESRLDEAREEMRKFRDRFDARLSGSERKTAVYALGMQFFRVSEGKKECES